VYQLDQYLGQEMDVFDVELYLITEATEVAIKIETEEKTTDMLIFYNNQVVVKRIRNTIAQSGQGYMLAAHQHVSILQMIDIYTHIL
jgi:hypothetical protein